jgi:di/tripeptidase
MDLPLLKEILAVPTVSREETRMIAWLYYYFKTKNLEVEIDDIGNVYVTKGKLGHGDHYPCVAAHTDTIHKREEVVIEQVGHNLIALDLDRKQTGLGGDDKAGIYLALQMIEATDVIKGAFFVGEEIYCVGSKAARKDFFLDVGYVMEFDSPCDNIMSYSCSQVKLIPDEGEFIDIVHPILVAHKVTDWQNHPFTDVTFLKEYVAGPCLNLPAAYFRMHSNREYVSLPGIENSTRLGLAILSALGSKLYPFKYSKISYLDKPRCPVRGLAVYG